MGYRKKAPVTLRLKNNQLTGTTKLLLTRTQINKINKSKKNGTGTDIRISVSQMRKQTGGSLGSLFASLSPYAMKALPALATLPASIRCSASALSSAGTKKVIGSGLFSVPQSKMDKLIQI